jgi:serine/threonine-protein kinase
VTEILGAIVHKDPDWSALPADTPPAIRRMLRRCLEKDPRRRLHDIADARLDIDGARETDLAVPATARQSAAAPVGRIAVAAVAAVAALAVSATHLLEPVPEAPPTRRLSVVMARNDAVPVSLAIASPSVDAAGQLIAVAGRGDDGATRLFVRRMNAAETTAIAGTDAIVGPPAVSPDGAWVAFAANRQLRKVALGGGSPVSLHPLPENPLGVAWAGNRSLVFAGPDGVFRIPAEGGTAERLTTVDRQAGELDHRWPSVSADGVILAYNVWTGSATTARVRLRSLGSGTERTLMDGTAPRITRDGILLFLREQALWAAEIDPATLELRREPVPVVDAVNGNLNGDGGFAVSDDGMLVYALRVNQAAPLAIADRGGRPAGAIGEAFRGVHHAPPRFSPRGDAVAVCRHPEGGADHVAIYRPGAATVLGPPDSRFPVWTPDGTRLTFAWARGGSWDIYEMVVNGPGTPQPIVVREGGDIPRSWSPDGQVLTFASGEVDNRDIWIVRRGEEPKPLVANPEVDEFDPAFSPDGRFIAYASESGGRNEVWVQEYPTPVQRRQISSGGGRNPVWGATSDEIYYENLDASRIVRVSRSAAGQQSELLFTLPRANSDINGVFDVSRHEGRLVTVNDPTAPDGSLEVIVGWFAELHRRMRDSQ